MTTTSSLNSPTFTGSLPIVASVHWSRCEGAKQEASHTRQRRRKGFLVDPSVVVRGSTEKQDWASDHFSSRVGESQGPFDEGVRGGRARPRGPGGAPDSEGGRRPVTALRGRRFAEARRCRRSFSR